MVSDDTGEVLTNNSGDRVTSAAAVVFQVRLKHFFRIFARRVQLGEFSHHYRTVLDLTGKQLWTTPSMMQYAVDLVRLYL